MTTTSSVQTYSDGDGECSAYSSLPAGSKVKFAAWPTSLRAPGTDRLSLRGPKWTLV